MQNTVERPDNKVYEVGYLLLSSIPEEKVAAEVTQIKDILAKHSATIISEGEPKLQTLSYTMVKKIGTVNRRFNQAYFGWVKFEGAADQIVALTKAVLDNPAVLRSIVINTVRENTMVSEMLNLKEAEAAAASKEAAAAEVVDKPIGKAEELSA